jgi:hypothetical protein
MNGKKREWRCGTIALTEFPLGPVTETQRPQFAASSHASPEKATPDRSEGSVYSVNEQVPPETLPP